MASQLTSALQAGAERGDASATAWLKSQEESNFAWYIQQLCVELGSKDRSIPVRQLAGLMMKNALDARNDVAAQQLHNRWKALPDQTRVAVKQMLLQILHDDVHDVRKTAALAVGKIASIELEGNPDGWAELIPTLDQNITKQQANAGLRQSSLEALGYVCEGVPSELLKHANVILGAIASGMHEGESNGDIKLAATTCLANAIEFIRHNMEQEADRGVIMNLIFSAAKFQLESVRVAAYQCLVAVATSYYALLPAYMGAIFQLTSAAIASEAEAVQLQAIEIWSTIADVELECAEEDADAPDGHKSRSHGFIKAAVQPLMPALLSTLTKQSEEPEDDEWTPATAAATCLGICAQVAGNDIVPQVLPFIQAHVRDGEWRKREAAVLAFGCILDGPKKDDLAPLVQQAFSLILSHMKDPHPLVQDTTAWTLGRICMLLPEVIDSQTLPTLMQTLIDGLANPSPKVASNVSWAIHNLASSVDVDPSNPNTSVLSPYFEGVVRALLAASARKDVRQSNLQPSIYEALNIMVHEAAPDVQPIVAKVMPVIGANLAQTLNDRPQSQEERDMLNESQALLCGTLQAIVTTLPLDVIAPYAPQLMQLFVQVLQSRNSTVHEEALMAIGAVADKIETQFAQFMPAIKNDLLAGLQNAQEYHVCDVAVHVTSDVARAVGPAFQAWGDDVMRLLLSHLMNAAVARKVKSHIIACIGDIALAVGGYFERYLSNVLPMLIDASKVDYSALGVNINKADFKPDEWDHIDYLQGLREAIIEAYSGMLFGMGGDNKVNVLVQQPNLLPSIVQLLDKIGQDPHATERLLRGSCGLIFDLVKMCGAGIVPNMRTAGIEGVINQGLKGEEEDTRTAALEARKALTGH